MKSDMSERSRSEALGPYLRSLREGKGMSLRNVEDATGKEVSNAYLSQLENGKITKPSPNILHSLAEVLGVEYAKLMERAGYISPVGQRSTKEKHGRAATFSIENLSGQEETELLKYLSWYRTNKRKEKS